MAEKAVFYSQNRHLLLSELNSHLATPCDVLTDS